MSKDTKVQEIMKQIEMWKENVEDVKERYDGKSEFKNGHLEGEIQAYERILNMPY